MTEEVAREIYVSVISESICDLKKRVSRLEKLVILAILSNLPQLLDLIHSIL